MAHWSVVVLVVAAVSVCAQESGSLRSALEAVGRRQRDLSSGGRASYYALSQYRHGHEPSPSDELAFLTPSRDFAGDGQPENIGYGYQKTMSGPQGSYSPLVEDRPPRPPSKALEKVLLEYLEDEYMNDRKNPYYHHPSVVEAKRSMFRERGGESESGGRLEAARKRENFVLPSSFRERIHSRGGELQDTWQQRLVENIAKDLDEENREEDNENSEERLYAIVQNLWDKYRQSKPQIINIEDMTPNDVQEIMQALSEEDVDDYKAGQDKRQGDYGGGFDYFNNAGVMGGWGGYRKRSGKQRLESNGQHGGNFLYSLKFVAPAINREAVETLRDDEGLEVPDERDEDIVRLAAALGRQVPEQTWPQGYEGPDALDELYGPSDDAYQRLSMAPPLSRKRYPAYGLQEVASPSEILVPEKKFIYEDRRKRYPVTKRSSNFYASPPLLHHKSLSGEDMKEVRKKKDSIVGKTSEFTDPKVAQELNQIFSSDENDVSGHNKLASTEKNGKSGNNSTDQPPVLPAKVENKTEKVEIKNSTAVKPDKTEDHGTKHDPHHHDEEIIEQPITMSRIQIPLDIKKKSIDWNDYFGIDRRRKKTGPMNSDKSESINSENQIDDDWLLHQYYKTLAMASIPLKKRSSSENTLLPTMTKRMEQQPFDTRLFKPDIFSRSAIREASKKSSIGSNDDSKIDNMDSKLRNIEDLIVNEAVKYTGSHESAEDPREIQEVKDKILSRLAAAYSLEKMRLALAEFKTSLQAQKMSQFNPENRQSSSIAENDDDSKKKRVAIKKEKAEDKTETKDEEKKRDDHGKDFDDEDTSGEFLEGPVDVEPMSEGYMGKSDAGRHADSECPILDHLLQKCRTVGRLSEDKGHVFLPLCSLHQICSACGTDSGTTSSPGCDAMFLTEADEICQSDMRCLRAARRIITNLRQFQEPIAEEHCWSNSCLTQYFLTSSLPITLAR